MDNHVAPMTKQDAKAIAKLHQEGIAMGFLTRLGPAFLRQLYRAIPSCPSAFGYVWQEARGGKTVGFISCSESTGRLYKQALLRRGLLMALPLIRFLVRPSVVKQMWQTFRYPAEVPDELPAAEVLSIVVSETAHGRGIGKALMEKALEEFKQRGIDRVKVAIWAGNEGGNRFYQRCGFALAFTREHHGLPMNIYVAETGAGS